MCYARRQRSSWARIKLSNNCILNSFELSISNPSFFLASFTFVWVYITLWRECISHFALLCTSLSVVQFSMTALPFLADSLTIISQAFCFVNTFFTNFSKKFWRFSTKKFLRYTPLFWGGFLFYHNRFILSIPFLNFFTIIIIVSSSEKYSYQKIFILYWH